jgi:hypothetical protein
MLLASLEAEKVHVTTGARMDSYTDLWLKQKPTEVEFFGTQGRENVPRLPPEQLFAS